MNRNLLYALVVVAIILLFTLSNYVMANTFLEGVWKGDSLFLAEQNLDSMLFTVGPGWMSHNVVLHITKEGIPTTLSGELTVYPGIVSFGAYCSGLEKLWGENLTIELDRSKAMVKIVNEKNELCAWLYKDYEATSHYESVETD